jgi:peroxiredoxin
MSRLIKGDQAPDITLMDTKDELFDLNAYRRKKGE